MGIAAPTPDDQPHTLLGDDMAEYQYVRTGAMWLMGRYQIGQVAVAQLVSGSATCWDSATGGNQVEGIKVNGTEVGSLPVDSDGYLPATWTAPVPTMWLDGGTGARVMAVSLDITGLSGHVAAADPHPDYLLESTYTTKGDLVVGSDSGPLRLPVGLAGQSLTVQADGTLAYSSPRWTGWRNINSALTFEPARVDTSDTTNLQFFIAREGNTVYLDAKWRFPETLASSGVITSAFPAGFRPVRSPTVGIWNRLAFDTALGSCIVLADGRLYGRVTKSAGVGQTSMSYYTADAWPAALPGSPA